MTLPPFIKENIPLAPLTTLGVGGPARFFAAAATDEDVLAALAFARERQLPVFILGGGSNLVVADAGFPGLVLQVTIKGVGARTARDTVFVTAGAGETWDEFVQHCVAHDWAGVECLSGIPGSVGGTPVQNVGAYGQEVSETLVSLRAVERETGRIVELDKAQCGFSYRQSIFNTAAREQYIVLSVSYTLQIGGAPALRYADVQKYFAERTTTPTLAEVRAAVLTIRARKAMVLDPHDPDTRSAGSFFKNPVLTAPALAALAESARAAGLLGVAEEIPRYPAAQGQSKIPAAWLIERAGFAKGYARGRVGLSRKHTLALVNRGGATAREVMELMQEIQARVRKCFGVELTPEPVFVGFSF